MAYKLTWVSNGIQSQVFPTYEEAEAEAAVLLLDADGDIGGHVWPNHPALEDADDRLYVWPNAYAGITKI